MAGVNARDLSLAVGELSSIWMEMQASVCGGCALVIHHMGPVV